MPYEPPPEIAGLSLVELGEAVAARRLPPVDRWTPAHSGDSAMRIAADGVWFHDGAPITRSAMVRAAMRRGCVCAMRSRPSASAIFGS